MKNLRSRDRRPVGRSVGCDRSRAVVRFRYDTVFRYALEGGSFGRVKPGSRDAASCTTIFADWPGTGPGGARVRVRRSRHEIMKTRRRPDPTRRRCRTAISGGGGGGARSHDEALDGVRDPVVGRRVPAATGRAGAQACERDGQRGYAAHHAGADVVERGVQHGALAHEPQRARLQRAEQRHQYVAGHVVAVGQPAPLLRPEPGEPERQAHRGRQQPGVQVVQPAAARHQVEAQHAARGARHHQHHGRGPQRAHRQRLDRRAGRRRARPRRLARRLRHRRLRRLVVHLQSRVKSTVTNATQSYDARPGVRRRARTAVTRTGTGRAEGGEG